MVLFASIIIVLNITILRHKHAPIIIPFGYLIQINKFPYYLVHANLVLWDAKVVNRISE